MKTKNDFQWDMGDIVHCLTNRCVHTVGAMPALALGWVRVLQRLPAIICMLASCPPSHAMPT